MSSLFGEIVVSVSPSGDYSDLKISSTADKVELLLAKHGIAIATADRPDLV